MRKKGIYWADKILGLTHIKLFQNKSSLFDAERTQMKNQHCFGILKIKNGLITLNPWQTDLWLPANTFGMINGNNNGSERKLGKNGDNI